MLSTGVAILLAIGYIAILYSIAYRGERKPPNQIKPYRYALAQGIHCTTWAFYGTITQAAFYGWSVAPTYVGAMLVFLFMHRIQLRLLHVCKQQNLTSIADVISHRYGKSPTLALSVALIALIGIVPYITLQLRAVSGSFIAVTGLAGKPLPWFGDIAALVALAMMMFAILFGTRRMSLAEQHSGLMDAVAFESVIKLLAFMGVGIYVSYELFDGVADVVLQAAQAPQVSAILEGREAGGFVYLTHILLGAISMFCLPRQFHVSYIENTDPEELRTARWAFPLYLFAINLFILPIALAGVLLVPEAAQSDTFMLTILLQADQPWITTVAFIGGLASATSMVIIATLALSIMMSNDVVMPFWLRATKRRLRNVTFTPKRILRIRRTTIAGIMALAFGFHKLTETNLPLVNAGLLSLALLAQLAPALLGGLIWQRGNKTGASLGIIVGTTLWLWLLFIPSIQLNRGLTDSDLSAGVLISLGLNLAIYIVVSWLTRPNATEQQQRRLFTDPTGGHAELYQHQPISWGRLRQLLARFFDSVELERLSDKVKHDLTTAPADVLVPGSLLARVERELSAVIGSAASRILLDTLTQQPSVPISQVVTWATEASQLYKFNRELLQASVENIPQGISVIDQDLRLVAWNHRYVEVFGYPPGFLQAGMPVADLLKYNAERGLIQAASDNAIEDEIDKRLNYLRHGSAYRYQRQQGQLVIELQGAPMPGGGFVTTYTDITELVQAQRALERVNAELEQRVADRTAQLLDAKQAEELAHQSKTRFFAAVSHDLMQPFNAATLFCDMLSQRLHGEESRLAQQIQQSLHNAEELLTMLLEMTRLEAGNLPVNKQVVALHDIIQPIVANQQIIAAEKDVTIRYVPSRVQLTTDRKMIGRIIQNLLSNAVRYTDQGTVLIGIRRRRHGAELQILDTGRGIPQDQRDKIFREFHQVSQSGDNPGIGLGLAIVDRMCRLLDIPLSLASEVGRGTTFSLSFSEVRWQPQLSFGKTTAHRDQEQFLQGKNVWLLDNDLSVLQAMQQLFVSWGSQVVTATQRQQLPVDAEAPDLLVFDYHLDDGDTGIEVLKTVRQHFAGTELPAIINSADPDETVREQVIAEQALFASKPIKVAALKRLIKRLLQH
ncbi:Aerobic respiration control sensor protein ArcB [Pseudidiomarina piscicola]|uniref:histidine kinase n=1 Tax=Pseudidiomarina piscicola TaxID=2614830 RepID=A0A7D9N2Q3_9GAMM|nr:PAS domain-containing hybrid sensor histidine kinase/response regulator [Pseudidiomarina piscicola]CAB0151586.1 Aerobic respiration control sensor protein ArcB [Pseudidiomarina piscicola]VZT41051.1 Aerobic respiration control sensor protein ArcB [Pseudomonas aeruginosa]